ncbi:MAG: prepilin-type N-terminal cleavage/methylation domain-containing protein [Candidatus Omnitrophota bacterium]|jgi:type II secretion system protein G|nr:MAG: prepilin-type N-terminal cleavage/methylation domain-containing protein [Candidatus Omnitrophota bacterium]
MKRNGFTLIELLIVVGIIGILAAIAVPNYINATLKTRVTQVKLELRNLGAALQTYRIDHNIYPRRNSNLLFFAQYLLPDLTSPIAYLSQVNVRDPFGPVEEFEEPTLGVESTPDRSFIPLELVKNSYTYTPYINFSLIQGNPLYRREGFAVTSVGPDRQDSFIVDYPFPQNIRFLGASVYHPSNGVISSGDIGFFGGDLAVQGLVGG